MKLKFEQVIDAIEEKAEQGTIKPGGRLPSLKALAEELNCNKCTVIRAYKEMEQHHKIYAVPKSGYYLVENKEKKNPGKNVIDFVTVNPDSNLLPYKEFNHCINRAVELYKEDLFLYGETQGFKPLRKRLVSYFHEFQIFTTEDRICITAGSQQALSILLQMPFPNHKNNILVEEPSYHLVHKLFQNNGQKVYGITRDFNGIDISELEKKFLEDDIKVFYTMPRMHNPLGTSYDEEQKKKIVSLAEKYDVYVVEDDYLGDIETRKNSFPLYYYDISGHVVYVQGFSKTFMPGIRVGAAILQENLIDTFLKYKRVYDLNTSVLEQGALEIFMHSGMFKSHRQKAKEAYQKKMLCVKSVFDTYKPSRIRVFIPETGFFIWIIVEAVVNMNLLIKNLAAQKVLVEKGDDFFTDGVSKYNGIRLSVARLSMEDIETGLHILCKELRNSMPD